MIGILESYIQPFSPKSRTLAVAEDFQIGLYDPAEADLELFCNCCSAGLLGERLYMSTTDVAGVHSQFCRLTILCLCAIVTHAQVGGAARSNR